MELTTTGIVIRKTQYRENAVLLQLLTGDLGIITVTAYGASSAKNGKSSGCALFAYGEYSLSYRHERYTLNNCCVCECFLDISRNYERFTLGCTLLSVTEKMFASNADKCADALVLLYCSLSCLAYTDMDQTDVRIFFILRALDIYGICPHVTQCASCGRNLLNEHKIYFSPEAGGALCKECCTDTKIQMRITPLSLEAVRRMLLLNISKMYKVSLPKNVRLELSRHLKVYYEYYI